MALVALLLIAVPLAGCVRIRANITVSPDDQVSGQIVVAAKPRNDNDTGPKLSADVPFPQKVAVSNYSRDGYVGSQAVFSDLTFAELRSEPQIKVLLADAEAEEKASPLLNMARNYRLAGKNDLAADSYRQIIAKFPDTTFAQTARRELDALEGR